MMKVVFAVALIVVLLLVGLPVPMGHMDRMGDCPACTSASAPFALGLCAGILSFAVLLAPLASSRLRLLAQATRPFLLEGSIFRPPRPA